MGGKAGYENPIVDPLCSSHKGMKLTFLLKPNLFLSKRTRAAVAITIPIPYHTWTVPEIMSSGVNANLVCDVPKRNLGKINLDPLRPEVSRICGVAARACFTMWFGL